MQVGKKEVLDVITTVTLQHKDLQLEESLAMWPSMLAML